MIFLKKKTRKYDTFFKLSEKMIFPKTVAPAHDLSFVIWKYGIFFPENMTFFPWAEGERRPISGNT